ncbi:MAG: hypothetical protein GY802_02535 [Gammaproteobacteria bacterium]|nr:hypothetical protein [Gammaproteobacteria bacterium]
MTEKSHGHGPGLISATDSMVKKLPAPIKVALQGFDSVAADWFESLLSRARFLI